MSTLYKYLNPERIDVLRSGQMRYTQPGAFNDPFEVFPDITGLGSREEILTALLTATDAEWTTALAELSPRLTSRLSVDAVRRNLLNLPNEVLEGLIGGAKSMKEAAHEAMDLFIGILSLTERRDSLLMWSHYAESHTGFVVGFDSTHPYFQQKTGAGAQFGHLRKVEYNEKRPHGSAVGLTGTEVFLVKSPHWEYEREWRMLRHLDECAATLGKESSYPIHLFDFPGDAVVEIIVGCRMSTPVRGDLMEAVVAGGYAQAEMLEAKVNETEFRLDFHRIGT